MAPDPQTLHAGSPVLSGIKWIAVLWFREMPWAFLDERDGIVEDPVPSEISRWREAISQAPDSCRAYVNLAHALIDHGWLEGSAACYRQALRLEPDNASLHAGLGALLGEMGRFGEAIRHLHSAMAADPDDTTTSQTLDFAIEDYVSGIDRFPVVDTLNLLDGNT